ncbi:acyl carrier protein, partial [Streptomyces exfoliatus]
VSVARHWKTLLGLEQVGLEDDFFDVGGSSVKLIELLHHLRTEFGVSVPVSRLYRTTTLHGMAATVQEVLHGTSADELPYLSFNGGQPRLLFAFPPAGGHGLVYRGLSAHL